MRFPEELLNQPRRGEAPRPPGRAGRPPYGYGSEPVTQNMRMLPSNLQAQKPTDTPNDRDIGIGVLRELREKLGEIILDTRLAGALGRNLG